MDPTDKFLTGETLHILLAGADALCKGEPPTNPDVLLARCTIADMLSDASWKRSSEDRFIMNDFHRLLVVATAKIIGKHGPVLLRALGKDFVASEALGITMLANWYTGGFEPPHNTITKVEQLLPALRRIILPLIKEHRLGSDDEYSDARDIISDLCLAYRGNPRPRVKTHFATGETWLRWYTEQQRNETLPQT